jgi:hypothetical protein
VSREPLRYLEGTSSDIWLGDDANIVERRREASGAQTRVLSQQCDCATFGFCLHIEVFKLSLPD